MTDVAHVLSLLAVAHLLSVMTPGANLALVMSTAMRSRPKGFIVAASFWPADRRACCPSTISCPHAARMSRPRLLRTETISPRSARIFANALTRSSDGRSKGMPAAAFSGNRFTLALMPERTFTSCRASTSESFTPASITYSNMIRRRFETGKRLHASRMSCIEYFFVGGTMARRVSSFEACSDTARFGISSSCASLSIIGTRPTVDSVTRFGCMSNPSFWFSMRSAFIVAS